MVVILWYKLSKYIQVYILLFFVFKVIFDGFEYY